jgi:hypothetical protein
MEIYRDEAVLIDIIVKLVVRAQELGQPAVVVTRT